MWLHFHQTRTMVSIASPFKASVYSSPNRFKSPYVEPSRTISGWNLGTSFCFYFGIGRGFQRNNVESRVQGLSGASFRWFFQDFVWRFKEFIWNLFFVISTIFKYWAGSKDSPERGAKDSEITKQLKFWYPWSSRFVDLVERIPVQCLTSLLAFGVSRLKLNSARLVDQGLIEVNNAFLIFN